MQIIVRSSMKYALLILLMIILCSGVSFDQKDCKLKIEKDSIKIYLCSLDNSRFKAVRSIFYVNGGLSDLAAIVLDIDHYNEWQYKTVSVEILKKISDQEIIYYTEVAAPILTDNRDFVIHLTVNQNPGTREMIIDLVSLPDYIPPKEDVIRVPYSKARWTVKSLSPKKLAVDYYIEIDLGGSVPAWLVNMVAHEAPYETFKDLREKIGRYKNSNVPFIQD